MPDLRGNSRFRQIMGGLFLLMIGFAMLRVGSFVSMFAIMAMISGMMMVAREYQQTNKRMARRTWYDDDNDDEDELYTERYRTRKKAPQAHAGMDQVYAHALKAAERAGQNPGKMQVLPVDIGVMAFRHARTPVVHRTQPVLDDVDYIQPFIQLRLPINAVGRIRFEITDSDGQVIFIHEDNHQLQRGRNLITPSTRLPIHDAQAMYNNWELSVTADGLLLASHHFGWRESTERVVRRHLREDGEINADMRAALQDSEPGNISLDELLSFQEDDDEELRQRY